MKKRQIKNKKPECPNCKTDRHVIELVEGFRCSLCGKKLIKDQDKQKTLKW